MELTPPLTRLRRADTHRLIPSRYPATGILDAIAAPADLAAVIELMGWTDDRISAELGVIHTIAPAEWVTGRPHATVIMAAFCHPQPGGARFTDGERGAWYAGFTLATALAETIHHRTRELEEIGVFETRVEMRQYVADFHAEFHDVRGDEPGFAPLHDPASYKASQALGRELRSAGSNGILYRSVRHKGGQCIACFRPPLVTNVRAGAHFEYRWEGRREPRVREMGQA